MEIAFSTSGEVSVTLEASSQWKMREKMAQKARNTGGKAISPYQQSDREVPEYIMMKHALEEKTGILRDELSLHMKKCCI
jgi:hypothetical protein